MPTPIPENAAPFSVEEVVNATTGRLIHRGTGSGAPLLGVETDTRKPLAEKVFVALSGEHFDAHRFLDAAVAAGAGALVVADCPESRTLAASAPTDCAVILVPDTLVALGDLARYHRVRWGGQLVAVAGSAGKTTTRSVCSALLESLRPGKVHSTRGNLNNRIGVPMTLLGLESQHELAVVELGTNEPGEVPELTRISVPDVGVLTLIDLEHTEGLGGLEGVEKEEASLLLALTGEGTAIGLADDERVLRSIAASPAGTKIAYGFGPSALLKVEDRELLSPELTRLRLAFRDGRSLEFESSLAGTPGALAVSAGVAVCETLMPGALDGRGVTSALSGVGEPGRSTVVRCSGGPLLIDDTYNSNPASVLRSIETATEQTTLSGGRLFLVLGEMLELGALSRAEHENMGVAASQSPARATYFVQGDAAFAAESARAEGAKAFFFEDAAQVVGPLASTLEASDVVLVKASRGVRAERVVAGVVAHFSKLAADASSTTEPVAPRSGPST